MPCFSSLLASRSCTFFFAHFGSDPAFFEGSGGSVLWRAVLFRDMSLFLKLLPPALYKSFELPFWVSAPFFQQLGGPFGKRSLFAVLKRCFQQGSSLPFQARTSLLPFLSYTFFSLCWSLLITELG